MEWTGPGGTSRGQDGITRPGVWWVSSVLAAEAASGGEMACAVSQIFPTETLGFLSGWVTPLRRPLSPIYLDRYLNDLGQL